MSRSYRRFATFTVALLFVLASAPASAKFSKKQREELQGYAERGAAATDAEARHAAFYVQGLLGDSASKKALTDIAAGDDKRDRLAARVALALAGQRADIDALTKELVSQGSVYGLLRTVVAPMPDGVEAKVADALLAETKGTTRRDAARYLAEQRGPLFELLMKQLTHKDDARRAAAAEALAGMKRVDAAAAVADLLDHRDAAVRRHALDVIVAFSRIPDERAAVKDSLTKALKDADAKLRERAARRLVELGHGTGASDALLEIAASASKPEDLAATLEFLVTKGVTPRYKSVQPWLEHEDQNVRRHAFVLAASSKNDQFVERLLQMHASTEFADRLLAVQALGRTQDPRALRPLQTSLFEMRDDIRMAAARSFRDYARPDAIDALRRSLDGEKNPEIQRVVLSAIGRVGGKEALQTLRFQVTHNDVAYKKEVIAAIQATNLPEGARALDVLLRDRNSDVQWRAFLATLALDAKAGEAHFGTVFRNPPSGFLDDIDVLEPSRRKLVYAYLLKKGSGTVRESVVRRAMVTKAFDDVLYELALDPLADSSLRRMLVHHFGNRGERNDIAVLERISRGKDPRLAHLAAWMLTRHPSKSLEATYRGYLASKDPVLSAIAAYGLATVWR